MKLSAYLSPSRHGIFYFRWPLPNIEGNRRPSIRISLRTRCPDRAGTLARYLASCGEITKDNKELARLKQDELRELVKTYFEAQLAQYLDWINNHGLSPMALEDARCEMLDHVDHLQQRRLTMIYLPINRFKRRMAVSDEDWLDSLPNSMTELRKGRRDMLQRVLEAAERGYGYSLDRTRAAQPTPSVPPVTASAALGEAIADFMTEHSRQWPEKTAGQFRSYLAILPEYFGSDRRLATITKQDASDVKKMLQLLPVSRNTKPHLKGLSLSEVVKCKGEKTISPKTINSHIDLYRRFFTWAELHGHTPNKLFDGMKVPKAKSSENDRKPFSTEQSQQIYIELTEDNSGLVRSESHKWGALLGLFTGARLNEICQLEIADIQQEDGIWYLQITDEGDNNKSVKADASRRKVPLHSELLRLGFLAFVDGRKGGKRLFPDYSFSKNGGYGRNLGRWFNESLLPRLGIKQQSLVFHSYRHTMVTRLGRADVPQPIVQSIVGHAPEGVTQEVYMRDGYRLAQLRDAIEKFAA
jgi:integrase